MGAGLGPVLRGMEAGQRDPLALLCTVKGPLTVVEGLLRASGSQSWPRTEYRGRCDASVLQGQGQGQDDTSQEGKM